MAAYQEKAAIQKDIISFSGGAGLTVAKTARYLGVERRTAEKFLSDIPYTVVVASKIYLAKDIADKIYRNQNMPVYKNRSMSGKESR